MDDMAVAACVAGPVAAWSRDWALLGLIFAAQHLHLEDRQVWAGRAGGPVLGEQ